jgi:S1-C subfamily serine protease
MRRLPALKEITLFLFSLCCCGVNSAQAQMTVPTSVNAGPTLDAAGPEQRRSLNAIYLIVCPSEGAGSGFLLDTGVVVTNVHVVATCTKETLVGVSAENKHIKFSSIIADKDRDLALLVPEDKLTHGLKLGSKDTVEPGTVVSTWGYPFLYNGASPLLSVGYVAGYREQTSPGSRPVKHIIVNGAFNHGNSGGPLLVSQHNEVIGVVVLTYNFYPPEVKTIIDVLSKQQFGMMVGTVTRPDGSKENLSEARVTAMVLDEFYQKTQVMIGEAIAVSELTALMKEKSSELGAANIR